METRFLFYPPSRSRGWSGHSTSLKMQKVDSIMSSGPMMHYASHDAQTFLLSEGRRTRKKYTKAKVLNTYGWALSLDMRSLLARIFNSLVNV